MTVEVWSVRCGGPGFVWPPDSANGARIDFISNRENLITPCQAYQQALEFSESELLIYVHDDVTIHDSDWLPRVLEPFSRPEVAVVGLGGATRLGSRDLYKKPYELQQMAREGYVSNQIDYAVHGGLLDGPRRVSVVDAFFIAVRRDFLVRCGGWPVSHLTHHCLDLWLACEAARRGVETWAVPVSCLHSGGGSSTKEGYKSAAWLQGGTLERDHQAPHEWLYDEYRDVLPLEVRA